MIKLITVFFLISVSMNSQSLDIINPSKDVGVKNWYIVNDDVMGGISKSNLYAVSYTHLRAHET